MIACYLWRRVGIAVWNLEGEVLDQKTSSEVERVLHRYELDPRKQWTESNFVYWHFHSMGIDERKRLQVQKELKTLLTPLAKMNVAINRRDITIHWDGARTRIEEATAMNEHIQ